MALASVLLVFAALRFLILARTLTGVNQVADALAATAIGVVGLVLLVPAVWNSAAWAAAVGVFLGVSPFVATRMWWSAQLRGATPPFYVESPLWMILAALVIVLSLVAGGRRGFDLQRFRENTGVVVGVAAAVGLVAIASVLTTSDRDFTSLRLSDPVVLLASVVLAVLAIMTRGALQNGVLAGWACGLCAVMANTVWLLRHAEFGLSAQTLSTHLALSFFAVIALILTVAFQSSRARFSPP